MNRIAAIFGASGTLGGAIARELAADCAVAAFYYNAKKSAEALVTELTERGCSAAAFYCDITDFTSVDAAARQVENRFGAADILVNCAGLPLYGLLTDADSADFTRVFDTNVRGVFHTCKAFLPAMIRQKQGSIVNISSIWGLSGASCEALYSAAKAAVIGMTKALAKEVAPSGITVNCIAPGFVDSLMNSALSAAERVAFLESVPLGRAGSPDEIAQTVRFLIENRYMTGQILSPNGGAVI